MRVLDGKKTLTQLTNYANKKLMEEEVKKKVPARDTITLSENIRSHKIAKSDRS